MRLWPATGTGDADRAAAGGDAGVGGRRRTAPRAAPSSAADERHDGRRDGRQRAAGSYSNIDRARPRSRAAASAGTTRPACVSTTVVARGALLVGVPRRRVERPPVAQPRRHRAHDLGRLVEAAQELVDVEPVRASSDSQPPSTSTRPAHRSPSRPRPRPRRSPRTRARRARRERVAAVRAARIPRPRRRRPRRAWQVVGRRRSGASDRPWPRRSSDTTRRRRRRAAARPGPRPRLSATARGPRRPGPARPGARPSRGSGSGRPSRR